MIKQFRKYFRAVLNDILSTILNRKFLMDIFEPTTLWQHAAVKSLMEKIVHASIMRLGHQSFEKLYDLMVMAFKYQLFAAPGPESLLDITLRHLENLAPMTDDPEISLQVQHLQGLVINVSSFHSVVNHQNLNPIPSFCLHVKGSNVSNHF